MSVLNCNGAHVGCPGDASVPLSRRPLHRLAEVRRVQGISRRTLSRHLDIDVSEVRHQEDETTDMSLSQLYQWQRVLDVPVAELLVESSDPLSPAVMDRAHLVRIMKTALTILDETKKTSLQRMAQTMVDQLIEMMPELEEVGPWHAVGKRRRRDDFGVAAQRCLSEDVFYDRGD